MHRVGLRTIVFIFVQIYSWADDKFVLCICIFSLSYCLSRIFFSLVHHADLWMNIISFCFVFSWCIKFVCEHVFSLLHIHCSWSASKCFSCCIWLVWKHVCLRGVSSSLKFYLKVEINFSWWNMPLHVHAVSTYDNCLFLCKCVHIVGLMRPLLVHVISYL